MAKAHAAEYGRSRADEYRRKAEDYRVRAEQDSGDRKRIWLDLAERWGAAADQVEVSLAAIDGTKTLFAEGVHRRQESPMQDTAHPTLNASSPPGAAPPMRRRRSGMIACGLSALALGLVGGVSLHRPGDRDQSAAGLQQTGSGTSRPGSVKQTRDAAAGKPSREAVLEQAIEPQSNVGLASPTDIPSEPVVQDASGNTKPAAQLPTPSLSQLISKPGRQPEASPKNKANVKPSSKDLLPNTDTKAIANWSVSGRI